MELNIDRDTKGISGTPDISDSIFSKIARSKIFVADISIINSDSKDRKCPNPNVMIELGYAARVLGWERIFCIYNLDYGNINDLPFDLRHRRPIQYSIQQTGKEKAKAEISKILTNSIIALNKNGGLFDKVDDYIKQKVDTEILTIAGHLGKLLFGYTGKSVPELTQLLMNLSDNDIQKQVTENELIGFQIFKNFSVHEQKFRQLADNAISSVYHNREMAAIMIEFINWTGRFDAMNSIRNLTSWFKECDTEIKGYTVLPPSAFQKNDSLPDRYVLLKQIKEGNGIVTDFGDFPYKLRAQNLLRKYKFNAKTKDTFVSIIRHFITTVNDWLDLTNGEFILDTYHNFELKTTHNNGIANSGA
ncbi:hypothetical protein GCM10027043_38640 [Ferruginibacter profundus]